MTGPGAANPSLLLGQRLREMAAISAELRRAEEDYVAAEHKANIAEWKAYLEGQGAVETRKIAAKAQTAELRFAAEMAEQKVVFLRREYRIADKRVDVGRTYSADLRAELRTLGLTEETA